MNIYMYIKNSYIKQKQKQKDLLQNNNKQQTTNKNKIINLEFCIKLIIIILKCIFYSVF